MGLKVLIGHGATIDTTTAAGKLVFGIFAALTEFERELIAERTTGYLTSTRARGRNGGRPYSDCPIPTGLGHDPKCRKSQLRSYWAYVEKHYASAMR